MVSGGLRSNPTLRSYLIGTRDDAWEVTILLVLSFDNCFNDARMVRAKVDEAMCDAGLCLLSAWLAWSNGSIRDTS